MRLLGYGEDALTLWALQNSLGRIIADDDDLSNVQDVFFRPSFGRRSIGSAAQLIPGPQFGEFDAIIVSAKRIYLVEAKWTDSGEIGDNGVLLRAEQIRRHRIFREYLRCWRSCSPGDWTSFLQSNPQITWKADDGSDQAFAVAPPRSRLADSLTFVLAACARGGTDVEDVLLIIHPTSKTLSLKSSQGFRCVEVTSPPMDQNFVVLGAA
jgi:hypothetical protein